MKPTISKKIILVGNFGVGKTSLIDKFVHHKFSENYLSSLGVKIDKKSIELEDSIVNLLIWDISGEISMQKINHSYYLAAHGIIYVYDLSRPSTFEKTAEDLIFFNTILPNAPLILAANKSDLIQESDLESISPFSEAIFTSAKEGKNVEILFSQIAQKLI